MIRRTVQVALLFLMTITFSAMSSAEAGENQYSVTSNAGNTYVLNIAADALEVMKPLPVAISITDRQGAPVQDAKLTCSLTMPAMAMPNNKPPIKASDEAGVYKGVFLLTMGGLWHVEISANYSSGEQDSVVIPVAGEADAASGGKAIDTALEELFQQQRAKKE